MGLDMYLRGRKQQFGEGRQTMDGFEVVGFELELGYWRKHPNLHGYIVHEFANDVDECQDIELDAKQIDKILAAISARTLPHTEGFFFGKSDGSDEEIAEDTEVFQKAKAWLEAPTPGYEYRCVFYRASW